MIVIQNAPIEAAQDEVILSAKYSVGYVSVILVSWCLVICLCRGPVYTIAHDIYDGIFVGGQSPLFFLISGSIILLLLLPLLSVALSPLWFKEIIFYANRVQIVRRIFRRKTIYYSNATVKRGTLLPGYLIEEVREKGQPQRTPFLYDFQPYFFPSEAEKKIETILDYLTDDSTNKSTRLFKRCMLPKTLSPR
jgi:hypothetical protein